MVPGVQKEYQRTPDGTYTQTNTITYVYIMYVQCHNTDHNIHVYHEDHSVSQCSTMVYKMTSELRTPLQQGHHSVYQCSTVEY